jgi:hypothetical protein
VTSNHTSFLIYKPVFQDQGCGVGTQNLWHWLLDF